MMRQLEKARRDSTYEQTFLVVSESLRIEPGGPCQVDSEQRNAQLGCIRTKHFMLVRMSSIAGDERREGEQDIA